MVTHRKTKLVFVEALILTIIVFSIGILFGIAFESNYSKKVEKNYFNSEIYLLDALALNELVDLNNQNCSSLVESNILFADKIYEEAGALEALEKAGKLTDNLELIHRRYDLLRTILWLSTMNVKEKCGEDFSIVVYVYEYKTDDLTKLAKQEVWEGILGTVKQEFGNKIILIPIAGNSDILTLEILLSQKGVNGVEDLPVVIINNDRVLGEVSSIEQFRELLPS